MAAGKVPGPQGCCTAVADLDEGTLARTYGQSPGPVCVFESQNRLSLLSADDDAGASGGGSGTKKPAPKKTGIEVHGRSTLTAAEWVAKIQANKDVLDFFPPQISSDGRFIKVPAAGKFKVPSNIIPRPWIMDWVAAFDAGEWELTTGVLEITVKPPVAGVTDPKQVEGRIVPNLDKTEAIDGLTQFASLGERAPTAGAFSVEFGVTVPNGIQLQTGKKTIVITTQIKLTLGGKAGPSFAVEDGEMVNSWFHEIACHAGRNSLGKPDLHGDPDVEAAAKDIDSMIPGKITLGKVFKAIQGFMGS